MKSLCPHRLKVWVHGAKPESFDLPCMINTKHKIHRTLDGREWT